jgi:hypothetical protein
VFEATSWFPVDEGLVTMKSISILLILWATCIVFAWISLPVRIWINSAAMTFDLPIGWLETINAISRVFIVSLQIFFGVLFLERGLWVVGCFRRSGAQHPKLWKAMLDFIKKLGINR